MKASGLCAHLTLFSFKSWTNRRVKHHCNVQHTHPVLTHYLSVASSLSICKCIFRYKTIQSMSSVFIFHVMCPVLYVNIHVFFLEFSVKPTVFKVRIYLDVKFSRYFCCCFAVIQHIQSMHWFIFIHSFPCMCLHYRSCFVLYPDLLLCHLAFAIHLLFWHELCPLPLLLLWISWWYYENGEHSITHN